MSRHSYKRYWPYLIFGLVLVYCVGAVAQTRARAVFNEGAADTIVIGSNRLEIDNKQNILTFIGDVDLRQDTLVIQCQEMFVYYLNTSNKKGLEESEVSIDKIVATGSVIISRPEGQAMAQKAVYYQKDEKVVLSGKPMLKRGGDILDGTVITLFLKEDRITVEGSEIGKSGDVLSAQDKKGGSVGP